MKPRNLGHFTGGLLLLALALAACGPLVPGQDAATTLAPTEATIARTEAPQQRLPPQRRRP